MDSRLSGTRLLVNLEDVWEQTRAICSQMRWNFRSFHCPVTPDSFLCSLPFCSSTLKNSEYDNMKVILISHHTFTNISLFILKYLNFPTKRGRRGMHAISMKQKCNQEVNVSFVNESILNCFSIYFIIIIFKRSNFIKSLSCCPCYCSCHSKKVTWQ